MNLLKIIVIIFIIFCSCNRSNTNKFYYIRYYNEYGNFQIDTVYAEHNMKQIDDSLFFKKNIILNGIIHELRKYSNIHKAPTDGDYVFYELDSLGIIFSTQISWLSYKRLYTDNDSINKIIDFALLKILSINEYEIKKYVDETSDRVIEFDLPDSE